MLRQVDAYDESDSLNNNDAAVSAATSDPGLLQFYMMDIHIAYIQERPNHHDQYYRYQLEHIIHFFLSDIL